MPKKFILAITGPAGSGKTTIGGELAKQLDKCVNIDADHIKHFIVSGFSYETNPDGTKNWIFDQWELLGDSIGLLARNFQDNGYSVIINGFLDEPAWKALQKRIKVTHKVLLLPDAETTIHRDKQRPGDQPMGEKAIREHHDYFSNEVFYKDFVKIDSTKQDIQKTIGKILEQIT